MLIKVDDQNLILEYATIGGLPDSIEYTGTIPDDFYKKFKPSFYMLQDNEIVENSDYAEPTPDVPDDNPSNIEQALTALAKQSGTNAEGISQLQEAVTALAQSQGGE